MASNCKFSPKERYIMQQLLSKMTLTRLYNRILSEKMQNYTMDCSENMLNYQATMARNGMKLSHDYSPLTKLNYQSFQSEKMLN